MYKAACSDIASECSGDTDMGIPKGEDSLGDGRLKCAGGVLKYDPWPLVFQELFLGDGLILCPRKTMLSSSVGYYV